MAKQPSRDLDRVLDLLWKQAENGSVTAQKALYEHYRRDENEGSEGEGEWSDLYENVTPLRRGA